jgi:hypothetical protein
MRYGIDIEEGALHGHDGRIVYADTATKRLYALLDDEARRGARTMIRTAWQATLEIEPTHLTDATGIVSATMRISDCVARSRIVLGTGLAPAAQVVMDGYEITIPHGLPGTIVAAIRRMDLGELTGVPMLKGMRVSHVRSDGAPLVLLWDDMPCHIVDAAGLAEDEACATALAA